MKEYKVVLSIQAKEDYKRIISYIKNKLLEPNIAEIYAERVDWMMSKQQPIQ